MKNKKSWREKNGRLIHDGDCHFWGEHICTCGLIHHLMLPEMRMEEGDSQENDWYWKERGMQQRQLDRVPKPLPWKEPTKAEVAERMKIIDEVFGKKEAE